MNYKDMCESECVNFKYKMVCEAKDGIVYWRYNDKQSPWQPSHPMWTVRVLSEVEL